jgi:hypothetical protein
MRTVKFLAAIAVVAILGLGVGVSPASAGWGGNTTGVGSFGMGLDSPFGPLITPTTVPQVPVFGP